MKNIYGLYKQSRNASWQLLIDSNIRSLPVSVTAISKSANIHIIKNSTVNELQNGESGVSIIRNDKWYIIYDDTTSKQRARYTIAHELGHIFLGHPLKAGYHARIIDVDRPEAEWQAERFAAGLLAPACVLWGLGLHTPEEIRDTCDISYTSAKIRAERMRVLYERNKFLTSPIERKLYENFKDYINENRQKYN